MWISGVEVAGREDLIEDAAEERRVELMSARERCAPREARSCAVARPCGGVSVRSWG